MIVSFVKECPLQVGDIVKMGNEEVMVASVGISSSCKGGEPIVGPSKVFRKKKDGTFSKMETYPNGGVEKDGVFYKAMYNTVLMLDSNGEVGVSGLIYAGGETV